MPVDAGPTEPIVEFAEVTPYEQYVGVRQLQGLVRTVTDHPAEPAFLVVTQIMELWFTLLRREWELAQRRLRLDDLDGALAAIQRSVHHLRSLNASWGSLLWMTPAEFNGFRDQLGEASGFQSYEYRHVEFLLGLKAESVVRPHRRCRPCTPTWSVRWRRPRSRTTSWPSWPGAGCPCRPRCSSATGPSRTRRTPR